MRCGENSLLILYKPFTPLTNISFVSMPSIALVCEYHFLTFGVMEGHSPWQTHAHAHRNSYTCIWCIHTMHRICGIYLDWVMRHYTTIYVDVKRGRYSTHLPPSAAYMRRWTGSALVHVMACRLSGAKPLPEPLLPCCQLDPWEQTLVKLESKYIKMYNGSHFVQGEMS